MKTINLFRFALFFLMVQSVYCQNDVNTLFVTQDTYVRGGDQSDENYGSSEEMELKAGANNSFLRDSYLQFDLDDFSSVNSARLLVYGYAQTTMTLGAYQSATTSWNENSITWNNRPAKQGLVATSRISATPSWIELDITELAQSRTGRLLTVILSDPEAINKTIFLSSKEEDIAHFKHD